MYKDSNYIFIKTNNCIWYYDKFYDTVDLSVLSTLKNQGEKNFTKIYLKKSEIKRIVAKIKDVESDKIEKNGNMEENQMTKDEHFENSFNTFKTLNVSNPNLYSLLGDDASREKFINDMKIYFKMFWDMSKNNSDLEIEYLKEQVKSLQRKIDDDQVYLMEADLTIDALKKQLEK